MKYELKTDSDNQQYLEVNASDYDLIFNPLLNKGMSFTDSERTAFGLHGLIPPSESNMDEQRMRSYQVLNSKSTDLEKYTYLRELQDSNEYLFYNLITHHITETMPLVYTPTVGLGCQQLSHIYRRPRGVYIAYSYKDYIDTILANPRFNNVQAIVVSDGERILGLGDQGAGGMGIPIGKLALYCACAGIHPSATLPILLDTGTDNQELIDDPLYIGWRHARVRGKDYDDFIDAFVSAVKKRFPHVLLQWEDFAQQNANPILQRYREELCTFNDDIQGTAAVAVGTLLSAIKVTGVPLSQQVIAIAGAGSAGCGISALILQAMINEGLSEEEARSRFYLVDRQGLLTDNMTELLPFQRPFMQPLAKVKSWASATNGISLQDVVTHAHPTVLIGVSGQPGLFNETLVREMAAHTARPIIFPLSNPTARSEGIPSDLLRWTNDQALVGTGSPFAPVMRFGKEYAIDQTNNSYIFPGMGLGLIAVKAKKVTDKMFMLAAKALAECSPAALDATANLLPPLTRIREVSYAIALAVAQEAVDSQLAGFVPENLEEYLKKSMWTPNYLPYRRK